VKEIPENLLVYLQWNPLFPFYVALDQLFSGQWPSTVYLVEGAAWAVGFFVVGVVVFLAREREFAVRF